MLGAEHVKWEHRDPSNASFRTTNENGSLNDQTYVGEGAPAELDPLGGNADVFDPYLVSPPPPNETLDSLVSYPSFGGASTFGTAYTWDGIRMPADELFEMAHTLMHGRFGMVESAARISARKLVSYSVSYGGFMRYFAPNELEDAHDLASETGNLTRYWIMGSKGATEMLFLQQKKDTKAPIDPRNVTRRLLSNDELRELRSSVSRIVQDDTCAEFIQNFLNTAAELNPQNRLVSTDIMSMFDAVAFGGGFWSAFGASYNTGVGDITKNTGTIYFTNDPTFYSFGPVNRQAKAAFLNGTFHGMAQTTIHELLHLAGFNDRALAKTAAFLRKETVEFDNSWEGTLAASAYWDNTLSEHCH